MLFVDINNLKAKKYKAFIHYAFDTCDSVSFVIDTENQQQNDFLKTLKLTCADVFLFEKFISVHPETGTNFDAAYLVSLKCTDCVKKIFFANFSAVSCMKDFDGVALPAELCFFRRELIWFKLISHEQLAFIVNETKQDITFLKSTDINVDDTI